MKHSKCEVYPHGFFIYYHVDFTYHEGRSFLGRFPDGFSTTLGWLSYPLHKEYIYKKNWKVIGAKHNHSFLDIKHDSGIQTLLKHVEMARTFYLCHLKQVKRKI